MQQLPISQPIHRNWVDANGNPAGATSSGVGFVIAWQRGDTEKEGRNGAYLIEVMEACLHQMQFYQTTKFACRENEIAIAKQQEAINILKLRIERREAEGVLGTHELDRS